MANEVQTRFPTKAAAVTKSDSTKFSNPSTVYVGGDGDVAVMPWNSSTAVTFTGLIAGSIVPVQVSQVMSTNTTATLMIRMWD